MTGGGSTRRDFLRRAALAACTPLSLRPALAQGAAGRVVVIGGGFAGATCAGAPRIKLADSQQVVALAEMSDGSFWSESADIIVTIAACVEDLH